MGCDIAIYIEEQNSEGVWKEVEVKPGNILPEYRHYKIWAFLFNVRNEAEWGFVDHPFSRRGLPADCSMEDVREDYEDMYSDWHSWSYILVSEIDKINWPQEFNEYYFKIFIDYVFPTLSTMTCPKEIRMVVCFHC